MRQLKAGFLIIILTFILSGCGKGSSVESQKDSINKCSLYITCENAINSEKIAKNILDVLPKDGVIFEKEEVTYSEGESVFDVLERELKDKGIVIESSITAGTGSVYVEGINNLYEFDCGEQSGWMYTVNGEIPNYSCSDYKVENGDEIIFCYTCNLGKDIK